MFLPPPPPFCNMMRENTHTPCLSQSPYASIYVTYIDPLRVVNKSLFIPYQNIQQISLSLSLALSVINLISRLQTFRRLSESCICIWYYYAGNKTYYVDMIPVHGGKWRRCDFAVRRVITALHAQRQTSQQFYGFGYVKTCSTSQVPVPVPAPCSATYRAPIQSSGSSGFLD